MKIKKNIKKIIILNFILIAIFLGVFTSITILQYQKYNNILNSKISSIADCVVSYYPEVDDEKIIEILNENPENAQNILKKYGYDNQDVSYIKQIRHQMEENIAINVVFIIIFAISLGSVYFIYLKRQDKKINEINAYMNKINNKDYTLKIEDNGEDELSKLRNELYKTTVLLKEAAENSEREKEQLSNSLTDISHQIKTPLTSIRIMLDNITENPDMDDNTKNEFIEDISKQIDWISSLVISLLKLAKFDAGVIKMNTVEINVEELIENIISNLSILLEIKNIEIVKNIDPQSSFLGDYKWQLEAFTNIIKNALEHSKENSKIYITVKNTNLFLKVIIKDEGAGIEKNELKHIFERFYKSKNSSDTNIGIGLSLAKTIIEKNNGYINVESKINEGTTFEIKYLK